MSVLGDPAPTHREVKHGLVDTPEEWVDRADLIFQLVNPTWTDHEVEHKFKPTPEEWVVVRLSVRP